jgi:predicted nucleotidyltransferase
VTARSCASAIQGSRASGTARSASDVDVAIRVSPERFDEILQQRFGTPNVGSAKARTLAHAAETGKIQTGELGLRGLRNQLQDVLGRDVQISVVRAGGAFDQGPFVELAR